MLSCRVGVEYVEDVEDAVQAALMSAVERWAGAGLPKNPSAWLFRVANNNLLGELRQHSRRRQILRDNTKNNAATDSLNEGFQPDEVQDDLLRMLFVCCDDAIPIESQIVLALKTLCGFDIREIAIRLFTTETNAYKRLGRARTTLRQLRPNIEELTSEQYESRVSAVRKVLYLLFTEGYLSSNAELALRKDLCDEAIRLTEILVAHPIGQSPETYALLALMHLHVARIQSRIDGAGALLLLAEQNRDLWDRHQIHCGLEWLARSAEGDNFSRYHAEAGIAAEHCLAATYADTRWARIVECYSILEQLTDSPLHRLNRAVAVAEWKGAEHGLAVLDGFEPPEWLVGSYLWAAVMADLHLRSGDAAAGKRLRSVALAAAPTPCVKKLLERRLQEPVSQ